ncbi:protein disulfide-isomerase 5-3 [Citrus sinensis]|uniref:Protein disulfide-isomerase 5-3 n=1 Tax=Citrus sinensis TaxID=2711 RepID=A0ACB8P0D4_CITSI|nr:protein disulfide-isomerase 5-3 [Citrus sinensis]
MLLFVTVDFDCSLLATRFYLFANVYNSSIPLYLKVGDSMKIPRDLTEASLSGAGLSIIAALSMLFLFGMVGCRLHSCASFELNNYLTVTTSTAVIVDKSTDGDFLRIDFNMSFPSLSCEFASIGVSDVLGTNRLNITKTIRKFSIGPDLRPTGSEFHSMPVINSLKHGEEADDDSVEGSHMLTANNFDSYSHEYDPEMDGRILLAKVDCTEEVELCRRHHIQAYPSIRIFRKGSDVRDDHGHHDHESYYGDRDTDGLVKAMEELVAPIPLEESHKLALDGKHKTTAENVKRPAPKAGGCRIEGYVRVKKVPGNLIISARSGAHSFDTSEMNMSHVISHLSFGRKLSPKVMSDVQRLIPYLGGSHDRLNGRSFINHREVGANVTIEHYLQIVKTEVITRRYSREHSLLEEYEYTAHSSLVQSIYIPAAKFHFELSPMQVVITEDPKSFSHFITNVCAIIGGVFTVAGILDAILHNTMRLMKKVEIGKNF